MAIFLAGRGCINHLATDTSVCVKGGKLACYRKHSKLSCNIAFNVSMKCHIDMLPKDVTPHQCCTFVFAVVHTVNLY